MKCQSNGTLFIKPTRMKQLSHLSTQSTAKFETAQLSPSSSQCCEFWVNVNKETSEQCYSSSWRWSSSRWRKRSCMAVLKVNSEAVSNPCLTGIPSLLRSALPWRLRDLCRLGYSAPPLNMKNLLISGLRTVVNVAQVETALYLYIRWRDVPVGSKSRNDCHSERESYFVFCTVASACMAHLSNQSAKAAVGNIYQERNNSD